MSCRFILRFSLANIDSLSPHLYLILLLDYSLFLLEKELRLNELDNFQMDKLIKFFKY